MLFSRFHRLFCYWIFWATDERGSIAEVVEGKDLFMTLIKV